MLSLFRNPLLQLARRLWWLTVLLPAIAWATGGMMGLKIALMIVGGALGLVAYLMAFAWGDGLLAAWQKKKEILTEQLRFLCPHCLETSGFHVACGACGNEVDEFTALTAGRYVNDCVHCHTQLFPEQAGHRPMLEAYCRHCLKGSDLSAHKRRVRITATLLPRDFETLHKVTGAPTRSSQNQFRYFCVDDACQLHYVLNISNWHTDSAVLTSASAFRHIEEIWLDAAGHNALEVARVIDGFLRKLNLEESARRRITVCLRQTEIEATIRTRLESLFGTVICGVEPDQFIVPAAELSENISPRPLNDLSAQQKIAGSLHIPTASEKEKVM